MANLIGGIEMFVNVVEQANWIFAEKRNDSCSDTNSQRVIYLDGSGVNDDFNYFETTNERIPRLSSVSPLNCITDIINFLLSSNHKVSYGIYNRAFLSFLCLTPTLVERFRTLGLKWELNYSMSARPRRAYQLTPSSTRKYFSIVFASVDWLKNRLEYLLHYWD